jgi:hypothetical protein
MDFSSNSRLPSHRQRFSDTNGSRRTWWAIHQCNHRLAGAIDFWPWNDGANRLVPDGGAEKIKMKPVQWESFANNEVALYTIPVGPNRDTWLEIHPKHTEPDISHGQTPLRRVILTLPGTQIQAKPDLVRGKQLTADIFNQEEYKGIDYHPWNRPINNSAGVKNAINFDLKDRYNELNEVPPIPKGLDEYA